MLANEYATTLKRHWKQWAPKKYARLQRLNKLNETADREGAQIAEKVTGMMAQGMQRHEAEEVVRDDLYPAPESAE